MNRERAFCQAGPNSLLFIFVEAAMGSIFAEEACDTSLISGRNKFCYTEFIEDTLLELLRSIEGKRRIHRSPGRYCRVALCAPIEPIFDQ